MVLSFAYGGLTFECFDHSVFWPFNVLTLQFYLPVTHYRPSTPLFGKIGYEMFHGILLMIYAGSENGDKERSLVHVQPGMQKPQHSSINFAVPNKTSIHTQIQKWHWFTYWNYTWDNCPACRTYEIATRFWVVVICPIIKCLTVLEFSFILFDLCLFITIFNFILNYVLIVTFWIFTYHKIWILLIIYCFIWSYWMIYFLTCLEVFWGAVS